MELILTKLISHAFGIMIMWSLMIAVVLIDLWTGIDKVRARKEKIHSHGLRMTITKIGEYWRVMVMFLFIDVVGVMLPWYSLPYASMVSTLAVILIELRSVIENLREKRSSAARITDIVNEIISVDNAEKALEILSRLHEAEKKDSDR